MLKKVILLTLGLSIWALPALAQSFQDVQWIENIPGVTLTKAENDYDDGEIETEYHLANKACLEQIKNGFAKRGYKVVYQRRDSDDPEDIDIWMRRENIEVKLDFEPKYRGGGMIYELDLQMRDVRAYEYDD